MPPAFRRRWKSFPSIQCAEPKASEPLALELDFGGIGQVPDNCLYLRRDIYLKTIGDEAIYRAHIADGRYA